MRNLAGYMRRRDALGFIVFSSSVAFAVGAFCGMLVIYQHAEAQIEQVAASRNVQEWADLTRAADFWREHALACRTDGVDSLRPVKEAP